MKEIIKQNPKKSIVTTLAGIGTLLVLLLTIIEKADNLIARVESAKPSSEKVRSMDLSNNNPDYFQEQASKK